MTDGKTHISAAEFTRNFGRWQARALNEPVVLTHHGRPRLVLMSVDAFKTGVAATAAAAQAETAAPSIHPALLSHMHDAFVAYEKAMRIIEVNRAAETFLRRGRAEIMGLKFEDAFPNSIGTIAHERLKRTLASGVDFQFEMPSLTRPGLRLAARTFPCGEGVGIVWQNTTERDRLGHNADVQRALSEAFSVHGTAATATVDGRGRFKTVQPALADWLGLDDAELVALRLSALAAEEDKVRLQDALHAAWTGEGAHRVEVALRRRNGEPLPVRLTFSPVVRDFAIHSLLVLATRSA